MNAAQQDKQRSRGISRDMSPTAIARRLDIVSELRAFALRLGKSRKVDAPLSSAPSPSTPSAGEGRPANDG